MREPVVIGVALLALVNFGLLIFGLPKLSEEIEVALVAVIDVLAAFIVRSQVTPVP